MFQPRPVRQASQEAALGVTMEAVLGMVDSTQAAVDVIHTQMALGTSAMDAIGLAAALHGPASVGHLEHLSGLLGAELERLVTFPSKLAMLDDIARMAPTLANAALNDLLSDIRHERGWRGRIGWGFHMDHRPWITSLPDRLDLVFNSLDLSGCEALLTLPEGLITFQSLSLRRCHGLQSLSKGMDVHDTLDLGHCTSLVSLSHDLKVGECLDLMGCVSWDGCIPESVKARDRVTTDRYPDGIPLKEWRKLHPNGE